MGRRRGRAACGPSSRLSLLPLSVALAWTGLPAMQAFSFMSSSASVPSARAMQRLLRLSHRTATTPSMTTTTGSGRRSGFSSLSSLALSYSSSPQHACVASTSRLRPRSSTSSSNRTMMRAQSTSSSEDSSSSSGGAVATTVEAGEGPAPTQGVAFHWITARVKGALAKAFGEEYREAATMVTAATKAEFGDYQCNAAMPLAKQLKSKPRDVAQRLIDALDLSSICEEPEIAGPGFINLRLKTSFVEEVVRRMAEDEERLGIPLVDASSGLNRVVVDFSSPNIAKEMHVGHLRSTIIGDTLCKVLEFRGHDVVRLNHVGDWGTQFGMLITYLKEKVPHALTEEGEEGGEGGGAAIGDLVEFYKKAKAEFDADEGFKERSRAEVVKLQAGDEGNIKAWKVLCETSRKEFQVIYDMLRINVTERGESFYNPYLPAVVSDLKESGLLELSDGAQVVYIDGGKNRDGEAQALIVQKTDGGFMYSTTDLAALRQRTAVERADRILYVTDSGQASHFAQVFQVARKAKFVPAEVKLQHVPFGLVQGEDGKKFKTRAGDTVKLRDLLDEAIRIAGHDLAERYEESGKDEGEWTEEERLATAKVVGLGAVKYADLSMNRESNYRFSYKKMLALTGNTAPYMLYAYVRIRGIQRKAAAAVDGAEPVKIVFEAPEELALGRLLVRLAEVLEAVEKDLYPNKLCEYLYELSSSFNRFYESCPVNGAETPELVASRTALCAVTAQTIKLSLGLLGIDTVDRL